MGLVRLEGLGKLKKKSPNRVSNPLPSGLWRNALTIRYCVPQMVFSSRVNEKTV
jgi:hypothetical protein